MIELMSALGFESWGHLLGVSIWAVGFSTMWVFVGRTCQTPR